MTTKSKIKVKGPRRTPSTGDWQTRVYLNFGALTDPIATQLYEQGFTIDARLTDAWQAYHDAIVLLKIHQLITCAEGDKAFVRLTRLITREVERIDKAKRRAEAKARQEDRIALAARTERFS